MYIYICNAKILYNKKIFINISNISSLFIVCKLLICQYCTCHNWC